MQKCPKFKGKFDKDIARSIVLWYTGKYDIKIAGKFVGPVGRAHIKDRWIKIPEPTNIERFMVCLHEIGHIIRSGAANVYVREYKCEMFAINTAIKRGLTEQDVAAYVVRAKNYVLVKIASGYSRRLNLKTIRPEVVTWLGIDFDQWAGNKVFVTPHALYTVLIFEDKETKNRTVKEIKF